jgi:hypothetical protein
MRVTLMVAALAGFLAMACNAPGVAAWAAMENALDNAMDAKQMVLTVEEGGDYELGELEGAIEEIMELIGEEFGYVEGIESMGDFQPSEVQIHLVLDMDEIHIELQSNDARLLEVIGEAIDPDNLSELDESDVDIQVENQRVFMVVNNGDSETTWELTKPDGLCGPDRGLGRTVMTRVLQDSETGETTIEIELSSDDPGQVLELQEKAEDLIRQIHEQEIGGFTTVEILNRDDGVTIRLGFDDDVPKENVESKPEKISL